MIVLIGFMGAGKSTTGRLLAHELGLPFLDSDQVIEQRTGRQISAIFAEDGEPAFRAIEHQAIAELLDGPDAILALGGGAPEHPATRAALENARVVYLRVRYDEALRRVGDDQGRPMLARPGLDEVYRHRQDVYDSVATLTVDTDGRDPQDVVRDLIAQGGFSGSRTAARS